MVGVPLPFISYGGTAMVTLGLALGHFDVGYPRASVWPCVRRGAACRRPLRSLPMISREPSY